MKDREIVEPYINEEMFKEIQKEILKIDYDSFCEKVCEKGLGAFKILKSIKDALILKSLHNKLRIESAKIENIIEYLDVLEIVYFVSLVEAYSSGGNSYRDFADFLIHILQENETISKKDVKLKKNEYDKEYSLSANVRKFVLKAPKLDKLYLSICIESDNELKVKHQGLDLLMVIVKKTQFYKTQFDYKRAVSKRDILTELSNIVKGKKGKITLKEVYDKLNISNYNESVQSLNRISNKLYDIRSKFLHLGEKKNLSDFFIDTKKGRILDFEDIDFFRLFIRTVMLDGGFEIDLINIASKKSF